MATVNVATSQNLTAVTYAQDDIVNVLDGATLTVNSQWSNKPRLIQALGTGRIEFSNTSTTTPQLQEFYLQSGTSAAGFVVTQNAVLQVLGDWIIVGTSTGTNNEILFSSNSIGGVSIDYPTMIQVETGSGTNEYEIWNAIPEDVSGGTAGLQGFNGVNTTVGTVAVTTGGVVTGTGTNFTTANVGQPFKLPGITRDFVVSVFTSTTSITIQELDGSTYTGGVVTAGATYIIRNGSLIAPAQVGASEVGKVLFFNPLTTAVRMGDGTNGTKIPTGARVRVPNIHFNSALQQTTLATAITGTGAQAFTLTTAIGGTSNGTYAAGSALATLLLVSGSTVERIFYSTRSGAVVSATGMARGASGTVAQASFPIGTTVYWIPTASTNNNASINASPSGTVDMQICSLGLRMITGFSAFASLTAKDFGYAYNFNAGNCAGAFDIDSLSGLGTGYQNSNLNGGISAQFSALLGIGNIRNVSVSNNMPGGANSFANIAIGNVQGLVFCSNLRSRHWGRSTSAGGTNLLGVSFQTVKCATPINGVYAAGSSVRFNVLDNLDTTEIYVSSLPNANTCSSNDTFIPINAVGITDSTIRGMQLWGGGTAHRTSLISIDSGSADVVFHNKGYATFNGGLQLSSIISDLGLNTIVAHISVSNPRITTFASVLPSTMAFNRGGFHRMLLIDSITSTASGSGANAKGGLGLDVIAGPHRAFQSVASNSIIPNLADVQPIVVMSNLAKTIGSVYVGAFSSQSLFNMYAFTGGTLLDNLGRIYYPAIGDSVIIKSVFPLRGITNFTGTAFDFNYNLGSGTNPIPAGTTVEFRMVNWGTANTGAFTAFVDNSSLETARAALTGYSSSVGIDLQFRITGTTAVPGRFLMSMKLPATIDAAYNPPVSETYIGIEGAQTSTLLAGYLNVDPNNPVLQGSLTMAGSFGSIPMPYDYDNTPVDYRLVARLQGWTFINITGIYLKDDISIPITQTQVVDLSNNPLYASGVTGVAVNYGASTVTLSASRSAVQVWSAVQDSLCQLANLTQSDPFSTTNGLSFVSAYTLVVTGTLTAGNVIGNVTLSGALSSGVAITGNVAQATPTNLTGVTITGNLTFNTNTPITVTLTNCTITGTVSNSGSGLVTITKVNTTLGTVGANVVAQQFATVSAPNLISGTRVRLLNTTDSVEMFNGVLASTGFSQSFIYTADKNITLTATYASGVTAKLGLSASGIFTATGATFLNSQENDTVYNSYAINGSAVTGFTADYVQDDINLSMATNFTASNLYAWWIYNTTTEDGIREFFGGITALDTANIRINTTVVSIFLDNSTALFIYQTDAIRLFRSDNVYPAKTVTTGGGGISVNWNSNVYNGTPENLATAVWSSPTANNTVPNSMGTQLTNGLTVPKFLALK